MSNTVLWILTIGCLLLLMGIGFVFGLCMGASTINDKNQKQIDSSNIIELNGNFYAVNKITAKDLMKDNEQTQ